jgi:hypothetical protein
VVDVSEEYTASIFRVKAEAKQSASRVRTVHCFLGLRFVLEAQGSMFFRNVSKLLPDYREYHIRK